MDNQIIDMLSNIREIESLDIEKQAEAVNLTLSLGSTKNYVKSRHLLQFLYEDWKMKHKKSNGEEYRDVHVLGEIVRRYSSSISGHSSNYTL